MSSWTSKKSESTRRAARPRTGWQRIRGGATRVSDSRDEARAASWRRIAITSLAWIVGLMSQAAPANAQQLVTVEPDDYGNGAVISTAVPGVRLSVEGRSASDPEITTIALGLGRASTGDLVFGYHRVGGVGGFTWRDDSVTQAFFVAEFDAPTAFVAIDVVRAFGPGESTDPAILTAFDAAGNPLETVQTAGGVADFETVLVSRPAADIRAIRVTGLAYTIVLDHLRFERDGELPPPTSEDRLQSCSAELTRLVGELEECRAEPGLHDTDGDGEHDLTDRCPETPVGEATDDAGCSLAQFCRAQPVGQPAVCSRSDWRNDEPLDRPRDCYAPPLRSRSREWSCEPRPSTRAPGRASGVDARSERRR